MIQIRNVPKDVHRKLKVRAAAEGITLSELLGRQARQLAEQPSLAELCERLRDREPVNPRLTPAQVLREARERP
jgi:plasmid stability protein